MALNVNPQVRALIESIASPMTDIYNTEKTFPVYSTRQESPEVKMLKRKCVHYIWENDQLQLKLDRNSEGKLVCEACGREVCSEFTNASVEKITDAIPVLNMMIVLGPANGLQAGPIATIIDVKDKLATIAQLCRELNEFIKREDSAREIAHNIGADYKGTTFGRRGFTQVG